MNNDNKNKQKLPLYGIGPYLILVIAILSLLGIVLSCTLFSAATVFGFSRIIFYCPAVLLILSGLLLWFLGAVHSDVDKYIKENKLKTDGVYAWSRNPIYSGWWFLLIGFLLFRHNLWTLPIIPLQWLILTVVLKNTEEKWLLNLFGEEYRQYCQRVNRLIPFPPKK